MCQAFDRQHGITTQSIQFISLRNVQQPFLFATHQQCRGLNGHLIQSAAATGTSCSTRASAAVHCDANTTACTTSDSNASHPCGLRFANCTNVNKVPKMTKAIVQLGGQCFNCNNLLALVPFSASTKSSLSASLSLAQHNPWHYLPTGIHSDQRRQLPFAKCTDQCNYQAHI
jgi:hypothetical protein